MTQFAFVFPGQGSQSRGMMDGYAEFAAVRDTFNEASAVLGRICGNWPMPAPRPISIQQ